MLLSRVFQHSGGQDNLHTGTTHTERQLMSNQRPRLLRRPQVSSVQGSGQVSNSDKSQDRTRSTCTIKVVSIQAEVFSKYLTSSPAQSLPLLGPGQGHIQSSYTTKHASLSGGHIGEMSSACGSVCEDVQKLREERRKKKSVSWKDDTPNGCLAKAQEFALPSVSQSTRIVQKIKCFLLKKDNSG